MKIVVEKNAELLGLAAARNAAAILQAAIQTNGCARIVLSTGASQFEFLSAFIKQDVDWSKVEMFHLDEYVGLPETHIASFRKYLKERFENNDEFEGFEIQVTDNGKNEVYVDIAFDASEVSDIMGEELDESATYDSIREELEDSGYVYE